MSETEFDPEDIGLFVLGVLSAGVMVGIVVVEAFGMSMGDTFSISNFELSLAWIVTLGTTGGILVTNNNTDLLAADGVDKLQNSGMADYYVYTILGYVGLLIAWVFIPEVSDFITSQDVYGAAFIAISAIAQAALGWMY
ncbi:hypothetical protein B4589_009530 [Halolamina sp. CBA1230]|uniref:hypothetical protein n=1 Tax=Halolamina sp. CBA1230 TaxID=1853690 RepID=UPI00117AF33E|nr:hypothetical protein [Halolamina sp. CBA1230]QKY20606.1 hypothetical protein B4589_009530 [Halolamina sp. CBA1230]